MYTADEVYQIYTHIASMCGNPDPAEGCRLIVNFCKEEMKKLDEKILEEQRKELSWKR